MIGVDQLQDELRQTLDRKYLLEKELSSLKYCVGVFERELSLRRD